MKRIFSYLASYKLRIALGMTIKFIGSIMDLILPLILEHIIDNVIPTREQAFVFAWGAVMLVCSVIALLFNVIANRMAAAVSRDTTERVRHDLFEKISYLSDKKIDEFSIPSLISRMTSDTYYIHRVVGMLQRIGIRAPILLLGGLIITMFLDPVMSLSLIVLLPFIFIMTRFISKKGVPLFTKQQEAQDEMVRVVRENAVGIRVIKALSKIDYERRRFSEINDEVKRRELKAGKTMASINPLMQLILNIGLILVVIIGAIRVNSGASEVGKIIAFLTYFTMILNAMMTITRIFTMYSQADASAKRIDEVLRTENELQVAERTEVDENEDHPHIEFKNVYFSYLKQGYDVSNISFTLNKGETLGIIGATGSGKTTLTSLLMRLYDVDEGEILVNGRNIKEYQSHELHEKFGVVFQNDILFEDTIENNIRFGRDISDESIRNAARYAQAAEFIENDKGYDGAVAIKGANLSGGQKQRLLIARALAGAPEILILDDSSSALDYKTDSILRREIRTHFSETTSIIITQRVSSVLYADKIIVLDDGKIAGIGTHEELLKTCSEYENISRLQLGV
ncbi:MAG: ABC transporter ATP-binding protein [Ruminococcaceae bacterium]|nr:ABC transporter ATP-binding protein [Oscillospiraceae bacterium]